MHSMPALDLITSSEAARILGVTTKTVNAWAGIGVLTVAHKLPGVRGPHLFLRAEVERLALARAGGAA